MILDNRFKKTGTLRVGKVHHSLRGRYPEVPEGLLKKCNKCGQAIFTEDVKKNGNICPKCGAYFRLSARARIEMIADDDSFEEWDQDLVGSNPLDYKGYEEKLSSAREKTGLKEAVVTGKACIHGNETVLGVCDGRFLMSSMGGAVGEKIARAFERAAKEKLPVVLFACSGGARMQEGMVSLMQMVKTSAAIKRHSDAGLLYISVLTDPTTGGVTASFAMLGDIIIAEPKALIGFAGPRVIEQTIRQKLPKGFQRSEFLLEHGFLDQIVERNKLRDTLGELLNLHSDEKRAEISEEVIKEPEEKNRYSEKTAWERVEISRKKDRPTGMDYIREMFTQIQELHGDRYFADDQAVIGAVARFCGQTVTVIAQEKGKTTKDNIAHNFGMASPEGYRKALRLMKQAEKFHRPVICFVDTSGAFCGIEAEERGQGEAIARCLYESSALRVPILSVIIGEGGSGGALALAVADEVWMLENSVYSILSPEGFASIIWKDSSKAKEAAEIMKLTARDLQKQKIVDRVFCEPDNYTSENIQQVTGNLKDAIKRFLDQAGVEDPDVRVEKRYQRFRCM